MNFSYIGLILLSLFCMGGLYAYVQEVRRLKRLVSSGEVKIAKVLNKQKIESGSESVTHYLVRYEYTDGEGKIASDEQDLNNKKYFDSLSTGDTIEILYAEGARGTSYPLTQVHADLKISQLICVLLIFIWVVTGVFFIVNGA